MRVLLDTNIVLHRETRDPTKEEIGKLFLWLDRLKYDKYVHQITIDELSRRQDPSARKAFLIKVQSYSLLRTQTPLSSEVQQIAEKYDSTENDKNDTLVINEVHSGRVDILITEDRKIHRKALELGIDTRVFLIDSFLEKIIAENPDLVDYKVPSVKKEYFGNINLKDSFFDSFREDYVDFDKWFNRKADETAYVCFSEGKVIAFLYLKREGESEPHTDITPTFTKKKRLKIGSFKVQLNGLKLGERFLKIVFENALRFSVDEIYVTLFTHRVEHARLISLLTEYGFSEYGIKRTSDKEEKVYTRDFSQRASIDSPKTTYPFMSRKARRFLVPIYPDYHTKLLPDSILRTESPLDFVENEPFRNAISKVYVSRSIRRDLKIGDLIVFYRTGGYHKSVITTLAIVDGIHTRISDAPHFIDLCRKRSVFSDDELRKQWNRWPSNRPFIVNFLYSYSFPKRLNLEYLIRLGIIKDANSAPRGFEEISESAFERIIRETESNERIIVD